MCDTTCSDEFRNRACFCYANINSLDPDADQTCMYDDEGILLPCDPGCCKKGAMCPGQCPGVKAFQPEASHSDAPIRFKTENKEFRGKGITIMLWILLWLAVVSTASLFF